MVGDTGPGSVIERAAVQCERLYEEVLRFAENGEVLMKAQRVPLQRRGGISTVERREKNGLPMVCIQLKGLESRYAAGEWGKEDIGKIFLEPLTLSRTTVHDRYCRYSWMGLSGPLGMEEVLIYVPADEEQRQKYADEFLMGLIGHER